MNDDLRLALSLADEADAITMRYFQSATLAVRTKGDRTPVSEADEAVERMIRERLERERPDDGILGEEFGSRGDAARRWIIDPIDATKNYVRGIPVFATLIALDGLVGVVSAPALGRRWWAARGEGAFCNGSPIRVSAVARLADAAVSAALASDLAAVEDVAWHARGLGDFWQHVLVAEGALDAAIDYPLKLWDYAALVPIVEEAGGRTGFTAGGQFVSSNGLIHHEIVRTP